MRFILHRLFGTSSEAKGRGILAAPARATGVMRSTVALVLGRVAHALLFIMLLLTPTLRARPSDLRLPFRTVKSMILVEGEVNGDRVTLLMDTGSTKTILDAKAYRVTFFPLYPVQHDGKSAGLRGESVSVRLNLKLANHMWVGQPVSIMNLSELNQLLDTPFDGLLGEDILREFRSVRIDYSAHIIELKH